MHRVLTAAAIPLFLLLLGWSVAVAAPSTDRIDPGSWEPVTLTGSQLTGLLGADPGDLFVYAYQPTNQAWQSIPFQIDQVDASGNYTTTDEIPTFDSNDELVLMVRDLGGPAPPAAWLSLTDRTSQPRVAVKVTDPLNPSDEGWVYVFRTQDSLVITTTDYINFNALNHSFDSPAYSAGLSPLNPGATGWHPGLDSLLIKNHVPTPTDILDRTHIRIGIRPRVLGFCLPAQYLCETGLGQYLPPDFDLQPTIDGPVRITGGSPITPTHVYRDSLHVQAGLDLNVLTSDPNVCDVTYMHATFDLRNPTASGYLGAQYYDSAGSTDVIDGVPASITGAPRSWTQYSGNQGTIVALNNLTAGGGVPSHYYRDNSATGNCTDGDPNQTGTVGSYGESGTLIQNPTGILRITLGGVILPPANGPVGQTARSYLDNPVHKTLQTQYFCSAMDLNHDNQVDVANDIGPAASVWGCTTAQPCYLPAADVDQNGVIDVVDVQTVSSCFGWMLPTGQP